MRRRIFLLAIATLILSGCMRIKPGILASDGWDDLAVWIDTETWRDN